MPLLGIRNGQFKGVYSYLTREEYNSIAPLVKGSSMRRFSDEEAEDALKWADVPEVKPFSVILDSQPTVNSSANANSGGLDLTKFMAAAGMSTEYVCTKCGIRKSTFSRFCTECGGLMEEVKPPIPNDISDNTPSSVSPSQNPSEWKCSQGHTNPININFCTECGEKKVVAQPMEPPTSSSNVQKKVLANAQTSNVDNNHHNHNQDANVPKQNEGDFDFENMLQRANAATKKNPNNSKPSNPNTASKTPKNKDSSPSVNPIKPNKTPEKTDSPSATPVSGDLISSLNTYSQSGALKEIILSLKQLGVPLMRIELVSGQELFIPLQTLYYEMTSAENNILADENQISQALKTGKIKKLDKSWLFPREEYLVTDFVFSNGDLYTQDIFKGTKKSLFIMINNIIMIEGVNPPQSINNYKLISNPDIIRIVGQLA